MLRTKTSSHTILALLPADAEPPEPLDEVLPWLARALLPGTVAYRRSPIDRDDDHELVVARTAAGLVGQADSFSDPGRYREPAARVAPGEKERLFVLALATGTTGTASHPDSPEDAKALLRALARQVAGARTARRVYPARGSEGLSRAQIRERCPAIASLG